MDGGGNRRHRDMGDLNIKTAKRTVDQEELKLMTAIPTVDMADLKKKVS